MPSLGKEHPSRSRCNWRWRRPGSKLWEFALEMPLQARKRESASQEWEQDSTALPRTAQAMSRSRMVAESLPQADELAPEQAQARPPASQRPASEKLHRAQERSRQGSPDP